MKIFDYKNWSITSRLVSIAILPIFMLVSSAVAYSYFSGLRELQRELDDRGNLLASILSVGSEYGVISGNSEYLGRITDRLLESDKSISSIRILGDDGSVLVNGGNYDSRGSGVKTYQSPILTETIGINPFDVVADLSVNPGRIPNGSEIKRRSVGSVQVIMTPDVIIGEKRGPTVVAVVVTLISVIVCAAVGLLLAHSLSSPLNDLIVTLKSIRNGNYQVEVLVTNSGEIGELQSATKQMAASLYEFKNLMESKVAARTESLRAARDEAVRSNDEKRKLIQKVNSAVEEERKNISIEIHDHLNAELIVIRLEIQRILDLSAKPPSEDIMGKIHTTAQSVILNTANLYEMARDIVKRLRPEIIDTLGLRDAVHEKVSHYDSLSESCEFHFNARGDFSVIDSDLAMTAFRLVQEALSNIMKHSLATQAHVSMDIDEDTGLMSVLIFDNGIGFDSDQIVPGIGLIGMRERVHAVSGSIDIARAMPAGTLIKITLPTTSGPVRNPL